MKSRLLFVEDDDTFRSVLERELRGFGHEVLSCSSAEDALTSLHKERFHLVLLDLRLPGMTGLEMLQLIKKVDAKLPVVFLTGHGALPDAVEAMRAGAYDFLVKPVPLDELELVLQRAIDHRSLLHRNRLFRSLVNREIASDIVGQSPVIRKVRSSIGRIAASEANVLVSGENGTGKELVARAIHTASPRSEAAFVVVNCGSIPAELFESELFGHTRGAFTGALRRHLGLIELAEEGTLFLDELGDLPLPLQPGLLRAVQFGEYRPVGDENTRNADVRFVACTNRNLEDAVDRGEFREDLYHRISTLGISVPPLRDRAEDIPLLAELFLQRHNDKVSDNLRKEFSSGALERLNLLPWTGNVRELENVVIRLVTLVETAVIEASDIDKQARPIRNPFPKGLNVLDLETLERSAVVQALRHHAGNRAAAATELGVAIKTLYNKIRNHRIETSEWK
jgi:two-component system response regulator HydG